MVLRDNRGNTNFYCAIARDHLIKYYGGTNTWKCLVIFMDFWKSFKKMGQIFGVLWRQMDSSLYMLSKYDTHFQKLWVLLDKEK